MKQKQILIILIVIILAVIACLTAYMLVNSHDEGFITLRISNSCTIEVPNENNTVEQIDGNITKFSFNSSNLTILHEKSVNNNELKSMNTVLSKDSQQKEDNIYHDDSTGTYSTFIENKNTGDALLITSNNLDLLKKVANSAKFTTPSNIHITNNNTNNTTDDTNSNSILDFFQNNSQSQQSSNQPSSSQSSSNNNPTPTPSQTPAPTPTPAPQQDDSSDSGSKQDANSKYRSFIPG